MRLIKLEFKQVTYALSRVVRGVVLADVLLASLILYFVTKICIPYQHSIPNTATKLGLQSVFVQKVQVSF